MPPDNDNGRPRGRSGAAASVCDDAARLPRRIDAFLHDALVEILLTAERAWWLRRAEDFERAKPVPGEWRGLVTTREGLSARWQRLDQTARACRRRAEMCSPVAAASDVAAVLREVA